ncbi:hypothetical protein LWP59_02670 [Amycolatopsis acidiphila]|uniref:Uncharacterized protein n=1 Tax=Amycolatopsis acidiphila TaxID=715473 RepID=A0A558A3S5_9PSEU|nr:hypothetical protein [Amycolatopsis acidiphila]TVT18909.1 hypothetical protein FNH06_26110 [Amycolatopsis acidiphila]UIJ60607.1 hypothetical protein LWP59_02670 [Amycolatopsis acidiphila]
MLDLREDMWLTCLDHHAAVVLDLLSGKLDDQQPPEVSQAEKLDAAPADQDIQDRLQAWREVLAFRAQAARLRALTDQLRFAIYALDETSAPLREVIDTDAHLAERGDREVRELPHSLETAARSARAVERIILGFIRALPSESPS